MTAHTLELRIARVRAKLTSREAAEAIGIAPHTLSRIEHGHTQQIPAAVVWRMASLYGCPVAQLMEALYGPAETGVTA
jgi:transcriptional regulator with XRE-family HTH domain